MLGFIFIPLHMGAQGGLVPCALGGCKLRQLAEKHVGVFVPTFALAHSFALW
jgi:hypothetical protein